jgi:hypothetical protein
MAAFGKRGVEAWWGFLAGALIIIVVVIVMIAWYAKVKNVSLLSVVGIGDKIANIFR